MAAGLLNEKTLMSDFGLINQHAHMETHDVYL